MTTWRARRTTPQGVAPASGAGHPNPLSRACVTVSVYCVIRDMSAVLRVPFLQLYSCE